MTPIRNLLLAATFEWGIGLHGIRSERERVDTPAAVAAEQRKFLGKIMRQLAKDYVLMPALSLRRWRRTLAANVTANVLRNLWVYVNIICGHIPDGAETFDPAVVEDETKGEWYLRQMLGTANFEVSPLLAISGGHLCYQIEHHLFPDLPSNRLAQISIPVRELCEKYDLPYNTGSLARQFLRTQRIIHGLAVPDQLLTAGRGRTAAHRPSVSGRRYRDRNESATR